MNETHLPQIGKDARKQATLKRELSDMKTASSFIYRPRPNERKGLFSGNLEKSIW